MLNHPIIRRELVSTLRKRRAMVAIVGTAVAFVVLVMLRWPTDARVDLSGAQSRQVFRMFGYGLLASLLLLAPAFPATSMVREKRRGTLALLLNSPMKPWSIYGGKLVANLGFVVLLVVMSVPAAAACYAMGGISLPQCQWNFPRHFNLAGCALHDAPAPAEATSSGGRGSTTRDTGSADSSVHDSRLAR